MREVEISVKPIEFNIGLNNITTLAAICRISSEHFNKVVPSYWLDVLLPNEIKFKPFPMISSTVLEDVKKVMSDAVNPSNFFSIDSIIEKDANLNIKDVLESKKKIYERETLLNEFMSERKK